MIWYEMEWYSKGPILYNETRHSTNRYTWLVLYVIYVVIKRTLINCQIVYMSVESYMHLGMYIII